MTTRTDHPRIPSTAVRLFEVRSEQGATHLWSRTPEDAAYTVYSHDLLDGMPGLDDLAVDEVAIGRPDYAACVATAAEHARCGVASLDLRHRLRTFAARAA